MSYDIKQLIEENSRLTQLVANLQTENARIAPYIEQLEHDLCVEKENRLLFSSFSHLECEMIVAHAKAWRDANHEEFAHAVRIFKHGPKPHSSSLLVRVIDRIRCWVGA